MNTQEEDRFKENFNNARQTAKLLSSELLVMRIEALRASSNMERAKLLAFEAELRIRKRE